MSIIERLCALAIIALCPWPVFGASFDCSTASTNVERMVCKDSKLSELDDVLGALYDDAMTTSASPADFREQQRHWLASRNKCDSASCVEATYRKRIEDLRVLVASNASSTKAPGTTESPALQFRLEKDTGWAVCRDYIKNLNMVQPDLASFSCGVQFHPDMRQFSFPEWQELDIKEHMDVVYQIESGLTSSNPPFETWKQGYFAQMRDGFAWKEVLSGKQAKFNFHPRLRQAAVRFEPRGPLVTVLGYTREKSAAKRCVTLYSLCPPPSEFTPEQIQKQRECDRQFVETWGESLEGPGAHFFVYEPETRHVRFIMPGDRGTGVSSYGTGSYYLFTHNSRGYLILVSSSDQVLGRVEHLDRLTPEGKRLDRGRTICNIPAPYPRH